MVDKIFSRRMNLWQVAIAATAILVTLGLYSFSAIAESHDKLSNTNYRVGVVEKRVDVHDATLQKQGDSLAEIDKKLAVAVAILQEVRKNTRR